MSRPTRKEHYVSTHDTYGITCGAALSKDAVCGCGATIHNECMASWEEWLGSKELKEEICQVIIDNAESIFQVVGGSTFTETHVGRTADAIIKLLGNDKKGE